MHYCLSKDTFTLSKREIVDGKIGTTVVTTRTSFGGSHLADTLLELYSERRIVKFEDSATIRCYFGDICFIDGLLPHPLGCGPNMKIDDKGKFYVTDVHFFRRDDALVFKLTWNDS